MKMNPTAIRTIVSQNLAPRPSDLGAPSIAATLARGLGPD
jgi:hypothetical protein